MENTIKILTKYGLSCTLKPEYYHLFSSTIFYESERDNDLTKRFTNKLFLKIQDPALFKEKLGIPKKYDVLSDSVLSSFRVRSTEEKTMQIQKNDYDFSLKDALYEMIDDNLEFYKKQDKKFKVKSVFQKENAREELMWDLYIFCSELFEDPATLPARQQLYRELDEALFQDKLDHQMKSKI